MKTFSQIVKIFFNFFFPVYFILVLPFQIWANINGLQPDRPGILLQSVMFLFAVGIFSYRLVKLIKSQKY